MSREDELTELRIAYPTLDIQLAVTDPEYDDDGNALPTKEVVIINATLHGTKEVPPVSYLTEVVNELIAELKAAI